MTAWERCHWAFSCLVGIFHQTIEHTVLIAWTYHALLMVVEIVVQVGEYTIGDVVGTYCLIIVLRPCHWQCDKYHIVDEECTDDYEYGSLKMLVTPY